MPHNLISKCVKFIIALGLAVFFWVILKHPHAAFTDDLKSFMYWGQCALDKGLGNVYTNNQCNCNYHPLFVLLYTLFVSFWGGVEQAIQKMHIFRWLIFPFDILLAYLVVRLAETRTLSRQIWTLLGLLALPVWWYNTFVWAQVDAVHSAFCLLALYLIWKRQPVWSLFFYVLALNAKLQAIVYLPVLSLAYLLNWRKMIMPGKQLFVYAGLILLQTLIFLPYLLLGTLHHVWNEIIEAVGHHPSITMSAYNIWFILPERGMLYESDQQQYFNGISHHTMGFGLFLLFSFICIWPILRKVYHNFKTGITELSLNSMLLGIVAMSLSFFMFNTQMHERYAIPALAPMWAYTLRNHKAFWASIFLSLAILLNQELVFQYFYKVPGAILHPLQRLCAYMYLSVLILAIKISYKNTDGAIV